MDNQSSQKKTFPKWAKITIIISSVIVLILGALDIVCISGLNYPNNYNPNTPDKVEIDNSKEVKTIFANILVKCYKNILV